MSGEVGYSGLVERALRVAAVAHREQTWSEYISQVHAWELDRYLNVH